MKYREKSFSVNTAQWKNSKKTFLGHCSLEIFYSDIWKLLFDLEAPTVVLSIMYSSTWNCKSYLR